MTYTRMTTSDVVELRLGKTKKGQYKKGEKDVVFYTKEIEIIDSKHDSIEITLHLEGEELTIINEDKVVKGWDTPLIIIK